MPRSIGSLPAHETATTRPTPSFETKNHSAASVNTSTLNVFGTSPSLSPALVTSTFLSRTGPFSSLRLEVLTPTHRKQLRKLLARAIHESGTAFDSF